MSVINRALVHQQAPAHNRMINTRFNVKGVNMATRHQNVTTEMALQYRDVTIPAARTFDKGVIDVEANESSESLKIEPVPFIQLR